MKQTITEEEYLRAKQIVQEYEQLIPNKKKHHHWECNECGSSDWTDAVTEEQIHSGLLACSGCGGDEFHLVEDV